MGKKEPRDDPISTASVKSRQSNQSLIKEENAADSSSMDGREKIEEVDNFIETTDKTVVDKLNKKRIISRCKICKKEIRRDGIKKHIRSVHKEYIAKMATGGSFEKEETESFPNFEEALNGYDMATSEEQNPQEQKSEDE